MVGKWRGQCSKCHGLGLSCYKDLALVDYSTRVGLPNSG